MFDIKREKRKLTRTCKNAKSKVITFGILACIVSLAPTFGMIGAIVITCFGLFTVGKAAFAAYNFEKNLEELEMSDEEIENHIPDYMPLVVSAGICILFVIAATVLNSVFGDIVNELIFGLKDQINT